MSVKLTLSLLVAVVAVALAANVLDLFNLDDGKKLIEVPPETREQPNRNCMCKGPACVCCVNFNITMVDIGGPGCVHMKYLSPEEGFSVKVSYGKNLIHNSKIQGANPAPVCLEVFNMFAHVCAKFHDLAPTSDGLRGCLQLQPKLLGVTQLDFPIGCFKSTEGGMEMEDPPVEATTTEPEEEESEEEEDDKDAFDVETFLHSVYKTAESGVELLSALIDNLPKNKTKTTTTTTPKPEEARRGKNFKHPNQL